MTSAGLSGVLGAPSYNGAPSLIKIDRRTMCSRSAWASQTGPYVAEGLASLITDVVGDNVAGAVDVVLTTDHDQIVSGRDAYCLGEDGLL